MGFSQAFPVACINNLPSIVCISKRKLCVSTAKLSPDNDPLLLSATASASLRAEPLFLDPYAGCFVPDNTPEDVIPDLHPYCLAAKFIDDKLLHTVSLIDGLKQLVFLTDGMDTRPYRLQWPTSTIIFDISPEIVFKFAAEKLKDVGAKIPKGCIFCHIPLESSDMEQAMQFKGYSGSRPSIWVLQGFPMMTLANFEEVLSMISSLAMKGSLFLGELPACLAETDPEIKSNIRQWLDKLFMSKGFRVEMINYEEIAGSYGKDFASGHNNSILFAAEQLLHSDDQMESWRREFQRIENEGDEDGFEEL
ncbi:S-adenosyl-L-methionine-dependent methyltransferase [Vigna unguiculata]|uniref:S-adenosyl-L-methionine-dependent methyltransferase n=1 Tax=Vigna unguiculata TaxID=3917 RepID=A0A4D6NK37_VIGUN|nr:S-adenosyl-L-methionine-dependent methyltransferase [Vigna unguiculata]